MDSDSLEGMSDEDLHVLYAKALGGTLEPGIPRRVLETRLTQLVSFVTE